MCTKWLEEPGLSGWTTLQLGRSKQWHEIDVMVVYLQRCGQAKKVSPENLFVIGRKLVRMVRRSGFEPGVIQFYVTMGMQGTIHEFN